MKKLTGFLMFLVIFGNVCFKNHNAIAAISDEQAHEIVLNGTPDDVKKLLQSGYDVNKVYSCNTLLITAIKSAARGMHAHTEPFYASEKIKILIDAGADVNAYPCPEKSMRPLAWAVTLPKQMELEGDDIFKNIEKKIKEGQEYCDFSEFISKPCKDISEQEEKQIQESIKKDFEIAIEHSKSNFINVIEILINNGADINKTDVQHQSLLHHAVINPQYVSLDFIKYLVEQGANINAQDDNGNTPLFTAFGLKNKKAVEALIKLGADTNIQANDGSSYRDVVAKVKRVSYQ